jgi:hypothetical protein
MVDHKAEFICALEIQRKELEDDEEDYEEGEVDLEAEPISALSDLKGEINKNKSLKEELIKLKEGSQNPKKKLNQSNKLS